jgi:16S rRNA (guanine527-N7)-methyltransferase
LDQYAHLLAGYELANVIGTKDRDQIVTEHLLDSLSCLKFEYLIRGSSLIDVGTGGGLPGVPLAIARSQLNVTLLEATKKKINFLKHVREELDLQNLRLLGTRAEEMGKELEYREVFEIATARALAALPVVAEYCAPFVKVGGAILAMKGRLAEEELTQGVAAGPELGLELRGVLEVKFLPELTQKERRLVVFEKVAETPEKFPRRVGLARKHPLGH